MEKTRNILKLAPEDYKIERMNNNTMAKFNFNENVIIINPDIVKLSIEEIEFIIFHEFCHLKYKTHCQKFEDLVKKYIPSYKVYEKKLVDVKY